MSFVAKVIDLKIKRELNKFNLFGPFLKLHCSENQTENYSCCCKIKISLDLNSENIVHLGTL